VVGFLLEINPIKTKGKEQHLFLYQQQLFVLPDLLFMRPPFSQHRFFSQLSTDE